MANESRVRRDVQSLIAEGPTGMKVLKGYATAIAAMKALDGRGKPTDPRSWKFQAAIHGYPGLAPSLHHPKRWPAAATPAGTSSRGTASTSSTSRRSSSPICGATHGR